MRAILASLNHCALPFLSHAVANRNNFGEVQGIGSFTANLVGEGVPRISVKLLISLEVDQCLVNIYTHDYSRPTHIC